MFAPVDSRCRDSPDITSLTLGNRCFLFVHQQMSWYEANDTCTSKRGQLAVITTAGVHEALVAHATGDSYWIGLKNTTWMWGSGSAHVVLYALGIAVLLR